MQEYRDDIEDAKERELMHEESDGAPPFAANVQHSKVSRAWESVTELADFLEGTTPEFAEALGEALDAPADIANRDFWEAHLTGHLLP